MFWCLAHKEEEPQTEYDELPSLLRWRMRFAKAEKDAHTGLNVLRLSNNRLVQTHCESTEYQALRLVDKHTSIPAYKVIAVYNRPEGKVVQYEGIPGKMLESCWSELSSDKRRRIVSDVGRFIDELRRMTIPKHFVIGDSTMGAALNTRFGPGRIGPFYTLDAFHKFLRRGHNPQEFRGDFVEKVHGEHPGANKLCELKFSHANLSTRNVLIDESGLVSAIIGWQSAGWYPEYWEYVQMCQNARANSLANEEWLTMMKGVVVNYDAELQCDQAIRMRFGSEDYGRPRSVRSQSPSPSMLKMEQDEVDDKNTNSTSG